MQFHDYSLAIMDFETLSEIGVRGFVFSLKQQSVAPVDVYHGGQKWVVRVEGQGLIEILDCTRQVFFYQLRLASSVIVSGIGIRMNGLRKI